MEGKKTRFTSEITRENWKVWIKLTEKQTHFIPKDNQAASQIAQRSCAVSITGGFQDDTEQSYEKPVLT